MRSSFGGFASPPTKRKLAAPSAPLEEHPAQGSTANLGLPSVAMAPSVVVELVIEIRFEKPYLRGPLLASASLSSAFYVPRRGTCPGFPAGSAFRIFRRAASFLLHFGALQRLQNPRNQCEQPLFLRPRPLQHLQLLHFHRTKPLQQLEFLHSVRGHSLELPPIHRLGSRPSQVLVQPLFLRLRCRSLHHLETSLQHCTSLQERELVFVPRSCQVPRRSRYWFCIAYPTVVFIILPLPQRPRNTFFYLNFDLEQSFFSSTLGRVVQEQIRPFLCFVHGVSACLFPFREKSFAFLLHPILSCAAASHPTFFLHLLTFAIGASYHQQKKRPGCTAFHFELCFLCASPHQCSPLVLKSHLC